MKMLSCLFSLCLGLTLLSSPAFSESSFVEVFRNDNVTIEAGIIDLERKIVHFGDVLTLAVNISYDRDQINLEEITTDFFSKSWTEGLGAYILDHQANIVSGNGTIVSQNEFTFQLLACPDEEILCKGTRVYEIPEFNLSYQLVDEDGNEISNETIQFRPWPSAVMVASAIPLGEEGELNTFPTYFPTGGYPDPFTGGNDDTSSSLIAGSLFLLLGGLLMSPFSFFKSGSATQNVKTRWEEVLEQLQAGAFDDDAHIIDAVRKCLVWYCLDELDVDPFFWVKHKEEVSSKQQKGTEQYEDHRKLFLDVLHSPQGQSPEIIDRLSKLVKA